MAVGALKLTLDDVNSDRAVGSRTTSYFENNPHRLFDLCTTTARVYGQTELADKLDVADAALTLTLIPGDAYAVYRDAVACDPRGFARSVCSLTSDLSVALPFVGVAVPFAGAASYCDGFVCLNDCIGSAQKMWEFDDNNDLHVSYSNKNFWELGKNMILLASAIAAIAGVVFPAIALAILSVAALICSMRAFLIEKAIQDKLVERGLQGIYN